MVAQKSEPLPNYENIVKSY